MHSEAARFESTSWPAFLFTMMLSVICRTLAAIVAVMVHHKWRQWSVLELQGTTPHVVVGTGVLADVSDGGLEWVRFQDIESFSVPDLVFECQLFVSTLHNLIVREQLLEVPSSYTMRAVEWLKTQHIFAIDREKEAHKIHAVDGHAIARSILGPFKVFLK